MSEAASRRELLEAALDAAAGPGAMPFETFMDLALYHPEGGFYTRPEMRVGLGGDFHTSPTISCAFGTCVARHLAQAWERLGSPKDLVILELGAGSGQLAEQILLELERLRGPWQRVRYHILERSPALRARQAERLKRWKIRWGDTLEAIAPPGTFEGQVLSNEVFDALATRRVIGLAEGFAEIGVIRRAGGGWRQVAIAPTTERLATALADLGVTLREGQQAEINLQAQDLMRALATWLGRGIVTTIDYGDEASVLYAPHRRAGTLRAYYRQLATPDPLAKPGEQDLTADVDFTTLERVGREAGLTTLGRVRQGEFLLGLGIQELERAATTGLETKLEADFNATAIQKLYRPEAMGGGFWVLVQSKGIPPGAEPLSGLGGSMWQPGPESRRSPWHERLTMRIFPQKPGHNPD